MRIELHRAAWRQTNPEWLAPVDLTVMPGEKVVLMGPQGSGKRALLSLLTGVRKPSDGMARFTSDGIELTAGERKQKMYLVPEGGGLWKDQTVWENLVTVCRLYGMSRGAAEISCERAVEECGLVRAEDIRFGKLPADWRIRAALAASVACGAETVGAAALTEGLFTNESAAVAALAKRILGEKTTVIICEEDPARAEAFGRRFLLLREGKILFDGTGEELKRAAHREDFVSAAEKLFREAEG